MLSEQDTCVSQPPSVSISNETCSTHGTRRTRAHGQRAHDIVADTAHAQAIERLASLNVPVGVDFLITGYACMRGSLQFDTAEPITGCESAYVEPGPGICTRARPACGHARETIATCPGLPGGTAVAAAGKENARRQASPDRVTRRRTQGGTATLVVSPSCAACIGLHDKGARSPAMLSNPTIALFTTVSRTFLR